MSARRATIADVARLAGVSPSTASVVFSGTTPVSDATREKVTAAAAELGYTGPDPRAASLRRGRSGIVAVVFEEALGVAFLDPIKTRMMDGLTDAAAPLGAGLLLLRDESAPGGVVPGGPTLLTAPVDAAVLVGCSPDVRASVDIVRRRGIPVVVIEGDGGPDVPRVELGNRAAQAEAARHLRELGHTRVAIVALPTDGRRERGWITPEREAAATIQVTRARLEGARDVFPDAPAYSAAGSFIDEGLAAGRVLFADPAERPTAVIAQSDLLAAGVIRAAEEAGLAVPGDVSVTGFDGIEVDGLAPYVLTTMRQDATAKGRAAGLAIAELLAGREAPGIRLTCEFRRGTTTAAPPARR